MSINEFKAMGKRLADHLAIKHGVKLKHSAILEALAAQFGFKSWNALSTKVDSEGSFLRGAPQPCAEGGYLLGRGTYGACFVPYDKMRSHTLICGQRGAGTPHLTHSLIRQQVRLGAGLLHLGVTQGVEDYEVLRSAAEQVGRAHDVLLLDFDQEAPALRFNPFANASAEECAAILMAAWPERPPSDTFWKQRASSVLEVLAAALLASGCAVTFKALLALVTEPGALPALLAQVPENSACHAGLQLLADQWHPTASPVSSHEATCLKLLLRPLLLPYATGPLGALLNSDHSDLDFTQVLAEKKLLDIRLPLMGKDASCTGLGRMLIERLRLALAHYAMGGGHRDQPPFLALMEEPGAYWIPGMSSTMAHARGCGVAFVLVMQSLSLPLSREALETMVGNTWTKVFFKQATWASAERASWYIGNNRNAQGTSLADAPEQLMALPMGEAWLLSGTNAQRIKTP